MTLMSRLTLISFAVLVLGSADVASADCGPGSVPGRHGPDACYYKLTIVEITDAKTGQVKGKVSDDTLKQQKQDNPYFDINAYPRDQYSFFVFDFANAGIQKDHTYEFMSIPHTFSLRKQ